MTLFVRDLTAIDASYLCEQRGLVGETWLLDLQLQGQLDSMNMVWDFGRIKKKIKRLIDKEIDHRLLIPALSTHTKIKLLKDEYVEVQFMSSKQEKTILMRSPAQAVVALQAQAITSKTLRAHLESIVSDILPKNITRFTINLRHEQIDGAYYHYSHGLKKHDGDCQRIAHGHRSMIEIYVNQQRDFRLEDLWAKRWRDIYLGSFADRVKVKALQWNDFPCLQDTHEAFRYQASQGVFELIIPKQACECVETDTTVELLSCYIFTEIQKTLPADTNLKVIAYEGIGKGAITDTNTMLSGAA